MSSVQELDDSSFAAAVKHSTMPVLVDFSATWCGPCKVLGPTIDAVAAEYQGRLSVYKVDVDKAQETAAQHRVLTVPTCVFFKKGQEVERFHGARDRRSVKDLVDKVLG